MEVDGVIGIASLTHAVYSDVQLIHDVQQSFYIPKKLLMKRWIRLLHQENFAVYSTLENAYTHHALFHEVCES